MLHRTIIPLLHRHVLRSRSPLDPKHIIRTMATFSLPDSKPAVQVTLTPDISKDQLLSFPAFKTWVGTLQRSLKLQDSDKNHAFHKAPYRLRTINIQSVDWFGEKVGFIKLKAEVTNDDGSKLPGSVFLRGGSVGMMVGFLVSQPMTVH